MPNPEAFVGGCCSHGILYIKLASSFIPTPCPFFGRSSGIRRYAAVQLHSDMKRAAQWEQSYAISSDDSSSSDSEDARPPIINGGSQSAKDVASQAESKKRRLGGMNYEALSKHGYRGGPSVLKVPLPRTVEQKEQDWSWSTGKRYAEKNTDESYEEQEQTKAAIARGEKLLDVQTNFQESRKDKSMSFSQKEKRKRDLGQASRGKNYVEEEKRLLRDSGIYSGFDS